MGWKDAPVVGGKSAWEAAPVVGKASAPEAVSTALNKSPMAGVLDSAASLASGAVAGPLSGLAGVAGALLPGKQGQGADWVNKVQDTLTYEPRTELGKGVVKAVSYPFQKLAEAGDAAGGTTAEGTGSPMAGAGINAALQAIPLVLGRVKPMGESAAALGKRTTLKQAGEQYDAGTTAAREAGYVVPPTQANPSLLNQVLEGVAGKIKTAQSASLKNQDVTNGIVRKSLGITDDAPLNVDSLQKVRKEAGTAYDRVRSAGNVVADEAYTKALDAIAEPYLRAAKDFPKGKQTPILDAVDAARVASFDAGSAVDQIRILRNDADKAYRAGDKALGGAYKGVAGALEEQLGRHLEQTASPEALAAFQQARQTIAQTYTVEKHLKSDGNVDAVGLARELKRKPLSGGLRTVAEFGEQFPKAAQKPERVGGVPVSALDAGIGGTAALALHNPYALAAVAARPLVRSAILSKLYQDTAAKPSAYGPSNFSRLSGLIGETQAPPLVPLGEMAQGQRN